MPLDHSPATTHSETTAGDDEGAATLRAVFRCEDGDYRGARCVLPTGEEIEVRHMRTPLYDLARELEKRGYGDCRLESFTPTGTPSLRGLVKVMARLTVEETDKGGLRLRKYRPFPLGRSAIDAQVELEGTSGPETPDRAHGPDRTTGEAA